ncbi:MAG: hypothetical protein QM773_01160 [Hyphomonadaceae bacterium]
MTKRPLVIVCDWIPPAFGAVGQYQLERAREAARAGRPTTLIGLGAEASDTEEAVASDRGLATPLRIVRLAAMPARKGNLVLRGLWAAKTNVRLLSRAVGTLSRGDEAELKVTGSPPFLAYLLLIANVVFLRRTVTYRMTDFYPEAALAAGKGGFLKPLVPVFHWLRRRAHNLEVLSECQERRLVESGIAKDRIRIVRDDSPVDFSAPTGAPSLPFPPDKAVLLYSGNLGVAHDIDTLAEAYRRHIVAGPDRVRLWLNATGVKVDRLVAFCREHSLPVHVTPPAPLDQLAGILSSATMHLVTLERPFWGYVIPSKIYACIESRRPVLYIGPDESDVHKLIVSLPGSASVRNGDVEQCLRVLDSIDQRQRVDTTTPAATARFVPTT